MASTMRGERLVNVAISFVVRPINIKAHIRLSALAPGEVSDLKAIPDAEGDQGDNFVQGAGIDH